MAGLFPDAAPSVSLADQIKCVERELRMRREVYGRRIAAGKMRPESADREILAMEAVLQTLWQAWIATCTDGRGGAP